MRASPCCSARAVHLGPARQLALGRAHGLERVEGWNARAALIEVDRGYRARRSAPPLHREPQRQPLARRAHSRVTSPAPSRSRAASSRIGSSSSFFGNRRSARPGTNTASKDSPRACSTAPRTPRRSGRSAAARPPRAAGATARAAPRRDPPGRRSPSAPARPARHTRSGRRSARARAPTARRASRPISRAQAAPRGLRAAAARNRAAPPGPRGCGARAARRLPPILEVAHWRSSSRACRRDALPAREPADHCGVAEQALPARGARRASSRDRGCGRGGHSGSSAARASSPSAVGDGVGQRLEIRRHPALSSLSRGAADRFRCRAPRPATGTREAARREAVGSAAQQREDALPAGSGSTLPRAKCAGMPARPKASHRWALYCSARAAARPHAGRRARPRRRGGGCGARSRHTPGSLLAPTPALRRDRAAPAPARSFRRDGSGAVRARPALRARAGARARRRAAPPGAPRWRRRPPAAWQSGPVRARPARPAATAPRRSRRVRRAAAWARRGTRAGVPSRELEREAQRCARSASWHRAAPPRAAQPACPLGRLLLDALGGDVREPQLVHHTRDGAHQARSFVHGGEAAEPAARCSAGSTWATSPRPPRADRRGRRASSTPGQRGGDARERRPLPAEDGAWPRAARRSNSFAASGGAPITSSGSSARGPQATAPRRRRGRWLPRRQQARAQDACYLPRPR